jgi:hypothetical protein
MGRGTQGRRRKTALEQIFLTTFYNVCEEHAKYSNFLT